jgi:hypothetical protein
MKSYSEITEEFLNEIDKLDAELEQYRKLKQTPNSQRWKTKPQKNGNTSFIHYENGIKKWKYQYNYGVATWTYYGNEKDKKDGRVGTSGKTVIKKFIDQDSYDFVRTEDFIERGFLICDARLEKEILDKYNGGNEKEREDLKKAIKELKIEFAKKINDNCKLNRNDMLSERRVDYYKKQHDRAEQMIVELYYSLAEVLQKKINVNIQEVITDLEEAEKRYLFQKGRDNYIKVDGPMVSAQFTQGPKTVPSSMRSRNVDDIEEQESVKPKQTRIDGNDDDSSNDEETQPLIENHKDAPEQTTKEKMPLLSNHVVDFTGVVVSVNNKVTPLTTVIGHSSYPPIFVKYELERRHLTYHAVRANVLEIAKNKILSEKFAPNEKGEVVVNLNSMMLLTPFIGKYFDNTVRNVESEVAQLSESAMALDMLNYETKDNPLTITIDGKKYKIVFNSSYMNVPVNMDGTKQTIMSERQLQNQINAKGFHAYYEKVNKQLKNSDIGQRFLQLIESPIVDKTILRLKDEINQQESELKRLNAECTRLLNEYNDKDIDPKKKPGIEKQYRETREQLAALNRDLSSFYKKVRDARKVKFNANKDAIEKLQSDIAKSLAANQNDPDYLLLQRFLRAQDMYYNKLYKEDLYHFQANYLLSLSLIEGEDIETFCKSGEDRTGWLRTVMLAYQEYNQIKGYDPDFAKIKKDPNALQDWNVSLQKARQLSASIENNAANSKARGGQVSNKCTGLNDSMIGDLHGKLAKSVVVKTRSLAALRQPSIISNSVFWSLGASTLVGIAMFSVLIPPVAAVVLPAVGGLLVLGAIGAGLVIGVGLLAGIVSKIGNSIAQAKYNKVRDEKIKESEIPLPTGPKNPEVIPAVNVGIKPTRSGYIPGSDDLENTNGNRLSNTP